MRFFCALCTVIILLVGCSDKGHPDENNNPNPEHPFSSSDSANNQVIDLSQIGRITPKGRVQDKDYNNLTVIDQLIAEGTESIPFLISKLGDETEIKSHIMDYWYKVTVGDIALVILTDFFTDSTWENTTIPGIGWDQMLERRSRDLTGEQVLREYIEKHGRKGIRRRWEKIWKEYKDRLYWDERERCFKVRYGQGT